MANLIFLVVVCGLYFLAFRRPGFACGYVLASYALEQCAQAFVPVAGLNDSLCNYLIAGAVLVGLAAKLMREGTAVFHFRLPAVTAVALIAYCYATLLWSLFPSTTERSLNSALPYLVVFAGLAPLLVRSPLDMDDALASFLVSSSLSLSVLLLFAQWGNRGVVLPFQGYESNPLAVTQAAGALLIVVAFGPQIRRLSLAPRVTLLAVLLTIVLFIFLRSASRGQIVSAVITTVIFSALGRGTKWLPLVFLGVFGLLAMGVLEEEVSRNAARWEADQVRGDILDARVGKAELLLSYWLRASPTHVILGLGHATAQDPRLLGGYPHVVPAEVLAEEGLVGFAIYLSALLTASFYLYRAYRQYEPETRHIVLAAGALLTYEFLLTLKQGTIFGAAAFLLLLVLPGSLVVRREEEKESNLRLFLPGVHRPT